MRGRYRLALRRPEDDVFPPGTSPEGSVTRVIIKKWRPVRLFGRTVPFLWTYDLYTNMLTFGSVEEGYEYVKKHITQVNRDN